MAKNIPDDESGNRQITLRDIAKELGVSHVTVSLALRNHPRISEATRERVQKKAEQMGYHPDPMLSALSHYRLTSKEKPVQAILAWPNPLKNPGKLKEHKVTAKLDIKNYKGMIEYYDPEKKMDVTMRI